MASYALRRFVAWLARNADGVIALALALVVGVIGVLPEEVLPSGTTDGLIQSVTLVLLALIGTAVLRDRFRSDQQFADLESLITRLNPRHGRALGDADESLEIQFADLACRLEGTFDELAELEAAMKARAAVARRLAAEAETNRREADSSREIAARRKEEADAFDVLLARQVDAVAQRVEKRGQGTQRRYMLYGVILGAAAAVLLDATKHYWAFWM
ncbi:hypothetical protein ACIBO2_25900 [Nonomuraea sp. NPDC050022]|uniref:hypothetical protein n=1 Tax=Nonomuraea sp. NPDC050022 TaxID=3364358 RepID=UPI003795E732